MQIKPRAPSLYGAQGFCHAFAPAGLVFYGSDVLFTTDESAHFLTLPHHVQFAR
jgi:hypothetical protein